MCRGHRRTNDHSKLEKLPSQHIYSQNHIKFNVTKLKSMIFTLLTLSFSIISHLVLSGTTILGVMQIRNIRISLYLFPTKTYIQLVIFISRSSLESILFVFHFHCHQSPKHSSVSPGLL